MTLCFITMIEQGVSFQWIQLLVCISLMLITFDLRDSLHCWYDLPFGYCICAKSLWAKYNGCVHYCGRCSLWVCEKKREGIFYFFVHPVKPIIRSWLWLRHTGVFAECICTIHRKHCRVHYIYLQQKFKGDPMWVFSSVFYCLWLSLGSL